jgi:hypothetical protein
MRAYTHCRANPSASAVFPEHAWIDVSNTVRARTVAWRSGRVASESSSEVAIVAAIGAGTVFAN